LDGYINDANIVNCPIRETYDVCQQRKMTRIPFPKTAEKRSKEVMDLVHTDVCDSMQSMTLSRKRYVLTFIDDH